MNIRAEEISKIIQQQVENFDKTATKSEVGTVLEVCLLYTSPSPRD